MFDGEDSRANGGQILSRQLRPEEEWARAIISKALAAQVVQHDDGSKPRMHDLDILYADGQAAAVEVTAAADPAAIELWNLMNGRGQRWVVPDLQGGWMVQLDLAARANELWRHLPVLLQRLERLGVSQMYAERNGSPLAALARRVGIHHASQGPTAYPGSIYITLDLPLERSGGFVADTGDAMADWIGRFLGASDQRDVLEKLAQSGAAERHAFVIFPGFTSAPFSVSDLPHAGRRTLAHSRPAPPSRGDSCLDGEHLVDRRWISLLAE